MGVDFADLNDDGVPDIYVSNITEPKGLQESQMLFMSSGHVSEMKDGIAPYVNRSEALGLADSGWAWDAKLDDFDNDGIPEATQATGFIKGPLNKWPEIQELATANDVFISKVSTSWPRIEGGADLAGHDQNPFFVRVGDHYVDIAKEIGFGEDYVSRGIAIADVDLDGFLDLIVSNMWGPATYYHNNHPTASGSLSLNLLLPVSREKSSETTVYKGRERTGTAARAAVGAAVTVTLANGKVLTRQVDGGNGHSGKRSPELHFGLGDSPGPVTVKIRWRDPQGRPQQQVLSLKPGRYTVLLAWPNSGGGL
jgi:hypothetical protein